MQRRAGAHCCTDNTAPRETGALWGPQLSQVLVLCAGAVGVFVSLLGYFQDQALEWRQLIDGREWFE